MTRRKLNLLLLISVSLLVAFVLAACSSATPPAAPAAPAAPSATVSQPACPEQKPCPDLSADVPNYTLWTGSPHAKKDAAPFTHWDTATPPEIPSACAKCHSTTGFQDFVGADGSAAGKVDANAKIGQVIECKACHNAATDKLTSVVFPSGATINGLGREAVCMSCHQGVASMSTVDDSIKKAGATDEDKPSTDLGFTNIHYRAASVARYGTLVKGGYQYPEKTYDALWLHADGISKCTDCHDPHSTQLQLDKCAACHKDVKTVDDVRNIRMMSSQFDYNGNGDVKEGIAAEVDGLTQMLLTAIQAYAKEVAGAPIAYSPDAYPYFFIDTNGNGKLDTDESQATNKYASFTPRLAKAAYNYQLAFKDPGAFAHGGKYVIELLYDSIDSLNQKLSKPVDLSKAHRTDPGHFAGNEEAFRHWDGADAGGGIVPGTCAKCHAPEGLAQFIKEGTNVSQPAGDGMSCNNCHSDLQSYKRFEVKSVTFPSGGKVGFADALDANLCISCHQGRESSVSVGKLIAGLDPDQPSDKLRFLNVHYFAAGATFFGTQVKGVYEFPGKQYAGANEHPAPMNNCVACHDAHSLEPKLDACKSCHNSSDPSTIRMKLTGDYNGNGDTKEGLKSEVSGLADKVYATFQAYAKDVLKKPIVYSPAVYPYFFNDTNSNGKADEEELDAKNGYASWSPRLLTAAYNYQYSVKDPGAYVHNGKYILQVLFDTIDDLSKKTTVDMKGLVRP